MKTIVWKDIRQNLPWVALALIVAAIAMAATLIQLRSPFFQPSEGVSICSSQFLLTTTFCASLWGIAVGLLLTIPELNRDRRSVLLHRPLSWTSIFLGKIAAGFALTLIPMAIPFLLSALWVATPGSLPSPFDWRMMAPGTADLLSGFVFSLAGMLTGLRPTRWYGSRALGLPAAAVCALLVHVVDSFVTALLILLAFSLVLGLAAWGSFLTGGAYRPQPKAAKCSLGICIVIGLLMLATVGTTPLMILMSMQGMSYNHHYLDRKGRILTAHFGFGNSGPDRITDLKGETVTEYTDAQSWAGSMQEGAVLIFGKASTRPEGYRGSDRYFLSLNRPNGTNDFWYFDFRRNLALGYGRNSRRLEQTIGPEGFSPAGRPNPSFEGSLLQSSFYSGILVFPKDVFYPDFQSRTVRRVFHATGPVLRGGSLCWAGAFPFPAEPTTEPQFCAVIADNRIHVLGMDGRPLFESELTRDLALCDQVSVHLMGAEGRRFVWYKQSNNPQTQASMPEVVDEYSFRGDRVSTHTLPPGNLSPARVGNSGAIAGIFLPPTVIALLRLFPQSPEPYPPGEVLQILAMSGGMALACAGVCYWLSRRSAFPATSLWTWTILVFLLGPWGLLTMAALQEWPARVPCGGCGKRRVVTRQECQHCGRPFAPPEKIGIEIIEPSGMI
jgi:hypothetical protein